MAVSYKGLAKPCSEDDFLSEQPATQRIQDVFLAVSADETFGCDAGPGMCWLRHVATRTFEAHGVEVHRLSGQPLPLARRLQRHLQAGMRQKTWAAERFSWGISDSRFCWTGLPSAKDDGGAWFCISESALPKAGSWHVILVQSVKHLILSGPVDVPWKGPLLCWTDLLTTPCHLPGRALPRARTVSDVLGRRRTRARCERFVKNWLTGRGAEIAFQQAKLASSSQRLVVGGFGSSAKHGCGVVAVRIFVQTYDDCPTA